VAQLSTLGCYARLMKSLICILLTAFLAVGLFFAGWRFGYHQLEAGREFAVPLIDTRLANAASKAVILHLMDLGQYSDARAIVQGQFNNQMLEVALDSGDWDVSRHDAARRACEAIVTFRNAYPSNYLCRPDHGDAWTVDQVNAYLKRMTEESKK